MCITGSCVILILNNCAAFCKQYGDCLLAVSRYDWECRHKIWGWGCGCVLVCDRD